MPRVFALLCSILLTLATPIVAQTSAQARALEAALSARAAGDWDRAVAEARRAGPLGRDVIEWHRLRASEGSFADTQAFLARRGDWPGLPLLRKRSEKTIPPGASRADVLTFFAEQAPRTGAGALRLAEALAASGDAKGARDTLVFAWVSFPMDALTEEAAFLSAHEQIIAPYHSARANRMLWDGHLADARRLLPRLSDAQRALAAARIGLRSDSGDLDGLIAAVPAALADHPGLAHARFVWRARKGRSEGAIEVLEARSKTAQSLGEPEAWANLRRRYARQLMRAGSDTRAYSLAARHHLTSGRHFADLEWLAGYIALRKLGDAKTALVHFERFETAVDTPISLGRAAYWQGRAHEAIGDDLAATVDYQRGAQHQTSFYGLLAAEKIAAPMDPKLVGAERFPPWQTAPYTQSSVFGAAQLLLAAGDLSLAERFLTHLAESLDRTQVGQMATMVEEWGQPHLQVMIAKRGVQYGMVLERPYFPLHPLANETGNVAPELALAIARRESEFDPRVVSGVGARGLMQVMPATAKEVAGQIGVAYDRGRLLSDGAYNARLGVAYLAGLQRQFGNSPVQIAAGYNAGPSRPILWMEERGDPRKGGVDVIDWIEHIPFRETRNYVMRVTESLPVYRARLSGKTEPIRFTDLLQGQVALHRPQMRPAELTASPATE